MKLRNLVIAGLTAVLASSAVAQMKVEEAIKFRQAAYRFMDWNFDKIEAAVKGDFNKDQVLAAAKAIQAVANSGMGALFPAGSDKGVGFHETHLKPEFFQKGDDVKKYAMAFNKEANEMAKVAETGDKEAVKAQLGTLGKTCKACHDDFRRKSH